MDDKRKRLLFAGLIIGTVTVGLVVLSRRVPREKWGETLGKIAKDGLNIAKSKYGDNVVLQMAEQAIDKALPSSG
jgi:hypothetical protein